MSTKYPFGTQSKYNAKLTALSDLVGYAIENRGKPVRAKSVSPDREPPYIDGSWAHYGERLGTDKGTTYVPKKSSLAVLFFKTADGEGSGFGFTHDVSLNSVLIAAFKKAGINHTQQAWKQLPQTESAYDIIEVDLTQPRLLAKVSEAKSQMAAWLVSNHLFRHFSQNLEKAGRHYRGVPANDARKVIEKLEATLNI